VIADAVMGLDNVLAVAGAAQGSYALVVLGLLISIPIVVWGSTQILKLVERYPAVIYFGAGILAWTAAKMILNEPMVKEVPILESALISSLFSALVIGGVLFAGLFKSQARLEANILAKLIPLKNEEISAVLPMNLGGLNMKRVLIPVDGSDNSQLALRYVINECISGPMMEVCLLNVQLKFSRHIGRFLSKQTIDEWHKERSDQILLPAQELLKNHNIPFTITHKSGDRAQIIASEAKRLHCHHIVMGTARKNSLTRFFENSTSNALIELTSIPVEIIAGKSISSLERWAVPSVGIGAIATFITAILD
jgi:nucleotide-binding universal stress UspA family protein